MSKIKSLNRFTAQEVLNMKSDLGREKWGHYPFYNQPDPTANQRFFSYRFDWRRLELDSPITVSGTTVSGSPDVTFATDTDWPKKGQYLKGTGISTDPVPTVVSKTGQKSFTMSENATASGTVTLTFWDPHPGAITAGLKTSTKHIDVSKTQRVHFYPSVTSYFSFSTTPTDMSATENRDNSPDPNDYLSGAQTGDLHVPGGYWIVDVPKLGPTVYFNIIPWYNWYNDNAYIRVLFEEEIDV